VTLQALADRPAADERFQRRRFAMKTLITTLTFATLILAPAFIQSAAAAPQGSYRTIYEGSYAGYPLSDWYRADSY
jgi:hypothetical protein